MKTRALKKIGRKVLVGILAVACVCSLGSIPMKAKAAEMTPTEKIWKEVVEEYGLKQEETTLVYDTDGLGRTTQVPQAVKSEQVNEDGTIEATYYVPYVLDENEELVNSFERVQGRSYSDEHQYASTNLIFSYTAMYDIKRQPADIGYTAFFYPYGLSASYRLTGNGEVVLITHFNGIYDIICNLFSAPYCFEVSDPTPTYKNYHMLAQCSIDSPTPGTTYTGLISNMLNGYWAKCEGSQQCGAIQFSFSYRNAKGELKSGKTSQIVINN